MNLSTRAADNPFRTSRIKGLEPNLAFERWEDLLQRFEKMNRRGAIVGQQGRGKTTLLRKFEKTFQNHGKRVCFLGLDPHHNTSHIWRLLASHYDQQDVIIIDSAHNIPRILFPLIAWKTKHAFALLISAHYPIHLPVLCHNKTNPKLFQHLVEELLGQRLPTGLPEVLEQIFHQLEGNIREAFLHLYGMWAEGEIQSLFHKEAFRFEESYGQP